MWTEPKNIVKTGFPCQPYKNGQKIASVYVIISYETGLPLYYRVNAVPASKDHNFLSFEEAMLFCDLNGYWVDTQDWDNPCIGLTKIYSTSRRITLEDGRTITVGY